MEQVLGSRSDSAPSIIHIDRSTASLHVSCSKSGEGSQIRYTLIRAPGGVRCRVAPEVIPVTTAPAKAEGGASPQVGSSGSDLVLNGCARLAGANSVALVFAR